jgi:hypothetical protein
MADHAAVRRAARHGSDRGAPHPAMGQGAPDWPCGPSARQGVVVDREASDLAPRRPPTPFSGQHRDPGADARMPRHPIGAEERPPCLCCQARRIPEENRARFHLRRAFPPLPPGCGLGGRGAASAGAARIGQCSPCLREGTTSAIRQAVISPVDFVPAGRGMGKGLQSSCYAFPHGPLGRSVSLRAALRHPGSTGGGRVTLGQETGGAEGMVRHSG